MNQQQPVAAAYRNGNLHINLNGHFSSAVAVELSSTIATVYAGKGNVFIHTANVTSIDETSKGVLADHIKRLGLPRERLYLTGEKGLDISPDNIKVIVYQKKKWLCMKLSNPDGYMSKTCIE
jgi:anti-anti-sigma regulatory factor